MINQHNPGHTYTPLKIMFDIALLPDPLLHKAQGRIVPNLEWTNGTLGFALQTS
jgi:hypothetical protein